MLTGGKEKDGHKKALTRKQGNRCYKD